MTDGVKRLVLLVIAGPNGSGKTTATKGIQTVGVYINADDIKKESDLSDLEAAQAAETLRNKLLAKGADFTFETVLSTQRNLLLMQKAKSQGYRVKCIYVLTCDVNINVLRVKERRMSGGHDVPEEKIRERYHRALALLPQVTDACDEILIYDNSVVPELIFSKSNGRAEITPTQIWPEPAIRKLLRMV